MQIVCGATDSFVYSGITPSCGAARANPSPPAHISGMQREGGGDREGGKEEMHDRRGERKRERQGKKYQQRQKCKQESKEKELRKV